MSDENNKTFSSPLTEEHIREAERLKKAWFDHVFSSIERLAKNVEKLSSDLQLTKTGFIKDIVEAKEHLRNDIILIRKDINIDIDKAERRLNRSIDGVGKSIDALEIKEVRGELKKDLETVKSELKKELDSIKKEALIPLKEDVVRLRLTMAKWGGLGGLIVTIILSIIKWLVPLIISGLKHTQ